MEERDLVFFPRHYPRSGWLLSGLIWILGGGSLLVFILTGAWSAGICALVIFLQGFLVRHVRYSADDLQKLDLKLSFYEEPGINVPSAPLPSCRELKYLSRHLLQMHAEDRWRRKETWKRHNTGWAWNLIVTTREQHILADLLKKHHAELEASVLAEVF